MTRTSMTLAPATSGPGPGTSALRETLRKTWLGLRDGIRAARRYQRLNAMSDAELARRGIARADVLRAAISASTAATPKQRDQRFFGR